jgi:hypothetical protein
MGFVWGEARGMVRGTGSGDRLPETEGRLPETGDRNGELFWILVIKTWSSFPSWYVIRNTWYQR